ncbi:MAG: tRNA lysidine(34) synthetase TilS, partial [Pontibacterium sp.]
MSAQHSAYGSDIKKALLDHLGDQVAPFLRSMPDNGLGNLSNQQHGDEREVVIALSGGLDSVVLLHLCVLHPNIAKVRALHINHHLQPQCDDWAGFCHQQCAALGVVCEVIDVYPRSHSEQDARDARYQAFESALNSQQLLLAAHHANDQAETLLYRLARGTGLTGMRGICRARKLGESQIVRPLLAIERKTLRSYAQTYQLQWIEDPSNQSTQYDRNHLRHKVL